MLILGIDPGVINTGYGLVESRDNRTRAVDYGTLTCDRSYRLPERLDCIYRGVQELCRRFGPVALAVEDVFFNKNVRTALAVGHVRGSVILAALHQGLMVYTYTPLQIKQTITGYGMADKQQVQRMVQITLKLPELPRPDHAADALAAALCHYFMLRFPAAARGEGGPG